MIQLIRTLRIEPIDNAEGALVPWFEFAEPSMKRKMSPQGNHAR